MSIGHPLGHNHQIYDIVCKIYVYSQAYIFSIFHGMIKTNQIYKVKDITQGHGVLPPTFIILPLTLPLTFTSQLHQKRLQAARLAKISCQDFPGMAARSLTTQRGYKRLYRMNWYPPEKVHI